MSAQHDAEKGGAYPTRWTPVNLACRNFKCRVTAFTGLVVHPLRCCPLCGIEGNIIPPGSGDPS